MNPANKVPHIQAALQSQLPVWTLQVRVIANIHEYALNFSTCFLTSAILPALCSHELFAHSSRGSLISHPQGKTSELCSDNNWKKNKTSLLRAQHYDLCLWYIHLFVKQKEYNLTVKMWHLHPSVLGWILLGHWLRKSFEFIYRTRRKNLYLGAVMRPGWMMIGQPKLCHKIRMQYVLAESVTFRWSPWGGLQGSFPWCSVSAGGSYIVTVCSTFRPPLTCFLWPCLTSHRPWQRRRWKGSLTPDTECDDLQLLIFYIWS